MAFPLRFRQIHLDFHTGPAIPDVGLEFAAGEFARTMKRAHVNSVTLFAKCHHGHLYYNTKHPARHPGLKPGLNLLGEQIEALHKHGIRAPIYLSVQCDEFAANTHPEWRVIDAEGKLANSPLNAGWHIVDMSSPYQDFLAEQLAEVLKVFKLVDGIFMDMCWDQPSISPWAIAGMLKQNLNPENADDRAEYAHNVALTYMARYKKMVDAAGKGRTVPVWFNSRPLWNFAEEKKFFKQAEIEALPTGGWGYMYFPMNVRFVRTFGLPCLGMTGRFHKSWADFGGIKPEAALRYECAQMLAHTAGCSVGDQMHPRGLLDQAAYDMIGRVYAYVEACEPWCENATPVTEIGVIRTLQKGYHGTPGDANEGVVRALQQLRHQFDFIPATAKLDSYRVIIVPDGVSVDAELATRLQAFIRQGGAVLFSGTGGLTADGKPVLAEQGIKVHGESLFSTTYLRLEADFANDFAANTEHVMYQRGWRLTPGSGATATVKIVEPYFERNWQHFCSHFQTPPDQVSPYAAIIQKGTVITSAYPLFKAYAADGNLCYRHLIGKCLARLLPEPLVNVPEAPSYLEVTVNRQKNRQVVHFLSYCPVRRTPTLDIVEEAIVLRDLKVGLRRAKKPRRVSLQPQNVTLSCEFRNGRAEIIVPEVAGHQMLVIE